MVIVCDSRSFVGVGLEARRVRCRAGEALMCALACDGSKVSDGGPSFNCYRGSAYGKLPSGAYR